jgi:hypothetical protein
VVITHSTGVHRRSCKGCFLRRSIERFPSADDISLRPINALSCARDGGPSGGDAGGSVHDSPVPPFAGWRVEPGEAPLHVIIAVIQEACRPERRDCAAGHVRLELRNVVAKYPFERSHRFVGIRPNSGFGDYSRLSCGGGGTQLGPNARISAGMLTRMLLNR